MGYAAKGTVYGLAGALTFAAAFDLGGQSTGKTGVIKFLEEQSWGKVILILLALGLFCYAFWRFYESLKDPENVGTDKKGKAQLVAYFLSGVLYTGLAVYTLMQLKSGGSSGTGTGEDVSRGLSTDTRDIFLLAVSLGLFIKGIYQFIVAYRGKFISKYHLDDIRSRKTRKAVRNIGYAGLYSRGVVVLVLAFIAIRGTSWVGSGGQGGVGGMNEAFSFLRDAGGPWLVGIIALGLMCYGIYMLVLSRYRRFGSDPE